MKIGSAKLVMATVLAMGIAAAFTPAHAADNEVVFGGFGGSFKEAMKESVIPIFEKKYNVKVVYVTGTSSQLTAKILANRENPGIDIIWGIDSSYYIGRQAGLWDKIDAANMPNLADLYPFAIYKDGTGVMIGLQSLVIEYNTKVFKEKGWAPPSSWHDLWDPKYKGHLALYNLPGGYATEFFSVVAKLTDSEPPSFKPAWDKMKQLVANASAFVDTPAQLDALFATGAAWITFNGTARVGQLAANGVPVASAAPKEGAIVNPLQFLVVKNGPNPKLATKFINEALGVEAQKEMAKRLLLGPVNRKVELSPEVAAKVPYRESTEKLWLIDQDPINANIKTLTERWTEVVSSK